jgi:hypothetical protein
MPLLQITQTPYSPNCVEQEFSEVGLYRINSANFAFRGSQKFSV